MKSVCRLIAAFCLLTSCNHSPLYSQWVHTNGPYGAVVYTLAAGGDGSGGTNIFAGTRGGVYRSSDNGATWVPAGLRQASVQCLAVVPVDVGTPVVLAEVTDSGIFRSSDNGDNWTLVDTLTSGPIAVMGHYIFACSSFKIQLSTDEGLTWNYVNPAGQYINAFAVQGTTLFVANGFLAVFRSDDSGKTWSPANSGLEFVDVTKLLSNGTRLYAGGSEGIYLSTDSGASWNAASNGLTNKNIIAFATIDSIIFTATGSGIFRSTDNGGSWSAINNGLTETSVLSLAVSGSSIFAGANGAGVFRSTDSGDSWHFAGAGMVDVAVSALAQYRSTPGGPLLYAAASGSGVFSTLDSGATWSSVVSDKYVLSLAVSDTNLYVGESPGGYTVSPSGTFTWNSIGQEITAFSLSGSNLYAAAASGGIYLSTNAGRNWKNLGLPPRFLSAVIAIPSATGVDNIFVGAQDWGSAQGYLYFSSNGGSSWNDISARVPADFYRCALTSFTRAGSSVFLATNGMHASLGIFCSMDGGQTWSAVNNGLSNGNVLSLASDGPSIFANTNDGVYRSTNGGASWTSTGLGGVNCLTISGGNVYAGTQTSGVWRMPLPSLPPPSATSWNLISLPSRPANDSALALFPAALSAAFAYSDGYEESYRLAAGNGYWIKLDSSAYPPFAGDSLLTDSVSVARGWNLIGSISVPLPTSAVVSNPPGLVTSSFYGYSRSYQIADTIEPGHGYWVKADSAGMLILAGDPSSRAAFNRIHIRPTAEMPPSPPTTGGAKIPQIPTRFMLEQNYPNPFNPVTTIRYELPRESFVHLAVFNILGQQVRTLVNEREAPGSKSVRFDGSNLPSGAYFYRITAGQNLAVGKLMLLK